MSEGKTKQAKPDSVRKALEFCSGCVSADTLKEAKNRYKQLSAIVKNLEKLTLDKEDHVKPENGQRNIVQKYITSDTKNVRFRDITDEDKDLGGPLFITLHKAEGQINLSNVWPEYMFLITVYKKQGGHRVHNKLRNEDTMEPSRAQDTISTILGKSQSLKKCDRNTVKKAYEQYHSLKHLETKDKNVFAVECHRLTVKKYNKVIIEPKHINTSQRHKAPELYRVLTEAWANGMEGSDAAIKNLFVLLEANETIMLHSEYDVRRSLNVRSSSAAKKTSKPPKTIEYVLNLCKKKYKPEMIEKANHEYKHLEKLDEEIKRHRDLEVRKDKWHELGASGPQELLDSIVRIEKPLHKVLLSAKDDGIQDSALALLEYGSLLHSESLLASKDSLVTMRQTEDAQGTKQTEPNSGHGIENVLINSKHLVNHEVYGQAYEEYEKLENYSDFIAKDDVLSERKHRWTKSVPNGPLTFLKKFESPTRPLHVVLNLAKTEHLPGSDMALREYGSLLHSEVLYESKDSVTQFGGEILTLPVDYHDKHSKSTNGGSERSDDGERHKTTAISTEIPIYISSGDDLECKTSLDLESRKNKDVKHGKPYQEMRHGPVYNSQYTDDRKLLELQQMCEILEEKLSMKNAEIEDLTSRLSQAASKSLMTNNPSIADLSDKNRPTKLGERFGQLYDNEWSDAHEKLQHAKKREHEILLVLSEIVKDCFSFCEKAFEQQVKRIQRDLETNVLEPTFSLSPRKEEFKGCGKKDKMLDFMCQQNATEFQKSVAIHSVPGLTQIYKELSKKKKQIPDFENLLRNIDPYVDASVELCWLMCVQTPPMKLVFATKNDRVDKSQFRLFGTTGEKVDICVWPALLLHDGGPVVMKGQVLPK